MVYGLFINVLKAASIFLAHKLNFVKYSSKG